MAIKSDPQCQFSWLRPRRDRKSPIIIHIDNHFESKIYTNGSTISGCVSINPKTDIYFGTFQIIFTGKATTHVDFLRPCISKSSRTFLKVEIPIPTTQLPESRVFESKKSYIYPLKFVVPPRLGTAACTHGCRARVREQHLQLPPTMGHWGGDDQAPETAKIEYTVSARVLGGKNGTEEVMEASHPVRVMPLLCEEPPVHTILADRRYRMSQTKKIRRNLLSACIGSLGALAVQPGPVELSTSTLCASASAIRLNLEFNPTSAKYSPPDTYSITSKIVSTTHSSLAPMNDIPDLADSSQTLPCPVVPYLSTNKVTLHQPERIVWEKKPLNSSRQCLDTKWTSDEGVDVESEFDGSRSSSDDESNRNKYVATLDIPFSIPASNKNIFLPTFQSCLISRTYTLSIDLSLGQFSTTLSLSVPLQIITTKDIDSLASRLGYDAFYFMDEDHESIKPPPYTTVGQVVA